MIRCIMVLLCLRQPRMMSLLYPSYLSTLSIYLQLIKKWTKFTFPSFDNLPISSYVNPPISPTSLPIIILAINLLNSRGIRSIGSLRCFSHRQLFFLVTISTILCQYLLIDIIKMGGMDSSFQVRCSLILSQSIKKPTELSLRMQEASVAKTKTLEEFGEEQTQSTPKNLLQLYDLSPVEEALLLDLDLLTSNAFFEELVVTLNDCISSPTQSNPLRFGSTLFRYIFSPSTIPLPKLERKALNFLARVDLPA